MIYCCMSKLDRLLGGEVSRRDFLRMTTIALGTCAAPFTLKACAGIQVSPDYIEFSESHISSIYVFDASAGKDYDPFKAKDTSIGRGVVFNWKQNANKNQINIEQQVYIDVESSYWPLHIDISTIGTEIPDFIEIGPSTVWHPITMDQNKKSVLLSLVEDWKNLLKEDRQGDGSRLVLIQKFITKNANIIKDNIH